MIVGGRPGLVESRFFIMDFFGIPWILDRYRWKAKNRIVIDSKTVHTSPNLLIAKGYRQQARARWTMEQACRPQYALP